MNKQDKRNLLSEYITYVKKLFFIVVGLISVFVLISMIVLPDERSVTKTDCRIFEIAWEQILENGERVSVELPGKVPAERGEVVTFATVLPEEIRPGENICFRPIWQDVDIYVGDELRISYSTVDSRPFGTNSAMRYLFVELSEEDAGKELRYVCSSNSKYAGDMRTSYIGSKVSIWTYFVQKSGLQTAVSVLLLLLCIFCILVCYFLKKVYKKNLSLKYLAWTIFFAALWMFSENDFRQLLIKNVSVLSTLTYWSLMVIPFPLVTYMNDVQQGRYQKIYFLPTVYSAIVLMVGTVLQLFDVVQFVQQIPYIHAGLLIHLVCLIGGITVDVFKKRISDYLFVGIGIYGLLFTVALEMVFYYVDATLSIGTILAIGLLFLFMMATIKTGQDLFRSEKKKQQAIMAREAQAKFLANMSHEIRTPINAIIGMNEMIMRENENEAIRNYAHDIQSASNMLLGLVNDVLDFSKIESGQLELVEDTYHLADMLRDELLLLNARAAGKPISVHVDVDEKLPSRLRGDELRIKQVFTNLLSNAVKYTKEGSVTLRAFFKEIDEENIELGLAVTDTGIGIRKEDMVKLFDSFKRLELNKNRNVQGTGLGLNIAKQLVDLMKGRIVVESEYEKGSTFTVYIPQKVIDRQPIGSLEKAIREGRKEKNVSESLFTASDASVLIVDDNSMNLSLMKGLLKRTQMKVDLATSGKECLNLTRKKKYDIIFMDHMMPEMDGIETLHRLRAETDNPNQGSTVIALTANAIAGCREMYLEYGFCDYFSKPIQADKLEKLLVEYLPGELVRREERVASGAAVEPVDVQAQPTEILTIDRSVGLMYCMDSEEFYNEILSDFCKQAGLYCEQIVPSVENRDWVQYARIAHSLKSNSTSIGAVHFAELSLRHELAGKEEDVAFIEKEYAGYVQTIKELVKRVEGML